MGKTDQSISASEITQIISGVMSTMEQQSAVLVQDSSTTIQLVNNSTNCSNRKIMRSNDTYVSYGTVFTSIDSVQTMYIQVINELQAQLESKTTGGGGLSKTQQEIVATIQNFIATILTQQTIVSYVSSISTSETSIQVCYGSDKSRNYIFGTSSDIYDFYYQQYSSMSAVQQVSADISNALSADASSKKTGILAVIGRVIAIVCIVIILVIGIVIVIIAFGLFGA